METIIGYTAGAPGRDANHPWDYWWSGLSRLGDNFSPADWWTGPDSVSPSTPPSYAITFLMYSNGQYLDSVGVAISASLPWNSVKDIAFTNLVYGYWRNCDSVTVNGFVDTCVVAPDDNNPHHIAISEAKRGVVDLGDGDNTVTVDYLSNEYAWSNNFDIALGNGNDTIVVHPQTLSQMDSVPTPFGWTPGWNPIGPGTPLPAGWTFNTAPDKTTVNVTLGSGHNKLDLSECSGTVTAGSGASTILMVDGHNTLTLGSGTANVTIASYNTALPALFALVTDRGSDVVRLGSGHADISIDDTMTFMTPLTTIVVTHGQSGHDIGDGPDVIRYGHSSSGSFVGGDWSALTLDLSGYGAGSQTTLAQIGDHTAVTIQDSVGGAADVLNLFGVPPSSIAELHLRFI